MNIPDDTKHKLTEDNKGFALLKKLGWSEGTGLGKERTGIVSFIVESYLKDFSGEPYFCWGSNAWSWFGH